MAAAISSLMGECRSGIGQRPQNPCIPSLQTRQTHLWAHIHGTKMRQIAGELCEGIDRMQGCAEHWR